MNTYSSNFSYQYLFISPATIYLWPFTVLQRVAAMVAIDLAGGSNTCVQSMAVTMVLQLVSVKLHSGEV